MKIITGIRGDKRTVAKFAVYSEQAKRGVQKAVAVSALAIQKGARQNITRQGAVDTGRLRSSIRTEFFQSKLSAEIGTDVGYGTSIEFGRRPGSMPPPEALRRWARRVLGNEKAAYPVARAIGRRGTPARPFLGPAYQRERDRFVEAIRDALRRRAA